MAALAYYALFQLPFWFPPRLRLWSASYAFGFNNGVAILAMAGLLAAVALLYVVQRHRACEPRIEFPLERTVAGRRSLVVALALVALLYAGLTFAMYVYSVRSASWLMWETRHFLHRTWLMDVYGLRPYTEFSAEYGPMLTYTPLVYVLAAQAARRLARAGLLRMPPVIESRRTVVHVLRALPRDNAGRRAPHRLRCPSHIWFRAVHGTQWRAAPISLSFCMPAAGASRSGVGALASGVRTVLAGQQPLPSCCCWLRISCSRRRRRWPSRWLGWGTAC